MTAAFRNPSFTGDGRIDVEIDHPTLGWIPHTCADGTGEPEMQALWDAIQSVGAIAPFVPPTDAELRAAWRSTAFLTRMNFVLACRRASILTTEEAIEAAKGGWPASFADALADPDVGMDPDEAQIVWATAGQVERLHPLIGAVKMHLDMTDEEVDALFGYDPAS